MELSVGYWAWIGSSSDHIILTVTRRSWRELEEFGGSWIVGLSVVDSLSSVQ